MEKIPKEVTWSQSRLHTGGYGTSQTGVPRYKTVKVFEDSLCMKMRDVTRRE